MAGGTLGAATGRADCEVEEGLIEVRRRFASNSLTLREGLSELFVDVDAVGEAVETGLKDLMLFLFFGMPGTSSALLSNAAAALKLKLKLEREKIERERDRERESQSVNRCATML